MPSVVVGWIVDGEKAKLKRKKKGIVSIPILLGDEAANQVKPAPRTQALKSGR